MRKYFIAAIGMLCALLLCQKAAAQSAEVHLLASNGIKAVVEDLLPQAEHSIGHTITVEFSPTANLKQKIEAGGAFDVVIVTPEAIADLSKGGKTMEGAEISIYGTPISRAGIGIAIRKGSPRPDISTPEAIKSALLNAKAVAYAPQGASTPAITRMLDSLGIAEALKSKTVLLQGSDLTIAAVLDGRADFVITLVSELLPIKGLEVVGPLPDKFQQYIKFSAAVSASTKNADAAKALVDFLAGPSALPVIKARGMEAH
ncbi:MAG: extracellular solute-binding protein [Acidobacteriia bacterium]|nr:extracellular solute-binding protein [Terriglobia bacterium]